MRHATLKNGSMLLVILAAVIKLSGVRYAQETATKS